MNIHIDLQYNGFESLMNDNYRIDADINETLHHGDVSSGIGLLNSHNIPQDIESSKLDEMNMSFDNGGINGDYFYMNSSTGSESNHDNLIDYTKKIDEISTNGCLRENNGLPDGVGIDDMLPASALNQYVNMEYNNEHNNLHRNGNISKSNNSSVSTLTTPSVTSTNDKGC